MRSPIQQIESPEKQSRFNEYSSVSILKEIQSKSSINLSERKDNNRQQNSQFYNNDNVRTSQFHDNGQFNTVRSIVEGKNSRSI
jgi:hypothetical protein